MKNIISVLLLAVALSVHVAAQKQIVAGPMPGYIELRTAKIWMQFADHVKQASIHYKPLSGKLQTQTLQLKGGEFNTTIFELTGLAPGTAYSYYVSTGNSKNYIDSGKFVTQELWQYRKAPPDFSFITGSCNYMNDQQYDRPGEPYGGDSSIFITMAKEKSAFMIWLGDNWYTRYPDYSSEWGLNFRPSHERQAPVMQKFLKSMSHYAIWDDHDYGPNDADKSYVLKEASRKVFLKYWPNPAYGMNNEGIYTMFTYNDVDFFLLDDRWFRSDDKMKDSIDGKINPDKKMFGDEQMEWLKNALLFSNSNPFTKFRVIVTGSQVLNTHTRFDALKSFRVEYEELMHFIDQNNIKGLLFLTGDRHHSEIIKQERRNAYTLYDVTISPLTSHVAKTQGAEVQNADRVGKEIDAQNYGRFYFSGEGKQRKLTVDILGIKGDVLSTWSVLATDLGY